VGHLIVLLGKEDALALCRLYGGQRIPSLRRLAAFARREMVVAGHMNGHTLADLASKYRLSLAGVKKIITEYRLQRYRLQRSGLLPADE